MLIWSGDQGCLAANLLMLLMYHKIEFKRFVIP
jgi:hypothetical protein